MSHLHRALGPLLSLALLVDCGSSSESNLFGRASGGAGGAAMPAAGAGGVSSSGGAVTRGGGASGVGTGGIAVTQSGGAPSIDSGAHQPDTGVDDSGSSGGTGGTGGTPGGAWFRCMKDTDCVDGRVCTASAQAIVVSGRPGGCVRHCVLGASMCDTPPDVGTVTCTQLLVTSYCTISCPNSGPCPAGMDCVLGTCFYTN